MNEQTNKSSAPALLVASSPHLHEGSSVASIMRDVIIALMPATLAAMYFFKTDAVRLIAVCVGSSLAAEWICRRLMRRDNTLGDFSAAITGLLLALNLPPALPSWIAALGAIFAIVLAKQVFGGLGYNPFNPALIGRAFLLVSFTGPMTSWSAATIDAATSATPLGMVKEALKAGDPLPFEFGGSQAFDFFTGWMNGSPMNGCIGETSAVALLVGVAYLLVRRVITWHIPLAYIGSVAIYATFLHWAAPESAMPPLFHILSGGLILGACFMATDYVTSPSTAKGKLIFGVGCGIITMVIRTVKSGDYPEGVSFAILLMNAFTPLINRATRRSRFGAPRSVRP